MPARTFEWRDDPTGTVIAVPDVRARFLKRNPDDPLGGFHSHEESNGIETWVVLEGKVRFEFDDGEVIATPGQSVVAYPHEKHRVSCAGDEPCVYFLTLTPHRCLRVSEPSTPPGVASHPLGSCRRRRRAS
jgi:mannose-6-phosphate isomerase-like protein (cupin superfamily)